MENETLKCPLKGIVYEEHQSETHIYYTLVPGDSYKMRVRYMDSVDEDGNVVPCYLRRLAMPRPYDFEKNEMGIEAE